MNPIIPAIQVALLAGSPQALPIPAIVPPLASDQMPRPSVVVADVCSLVEIEPEMRHLIDATILRTFEHKFYL